MGPVQRFLKGRIRAGKPGPSAEQRERGLTLLWGEASDGTAAVSTRLRTPQGYRLTAMTAVAAVQRTLGGEARAGFQTPSRAYGADWILDFEGVTREDI